MLKVKIEADAIRMGRRFSVAFQRTLRIPDDGKPYPLPPGLGRFPLCRIEDYVDRVPAPWRERGGVFLPMYQREALWLAFEGASWKPNAVQIGVGGINAVSGGKWKEKLTARPQSYIVCPEQPWLDGINSGEGIVRQFVAMPLGQGYTVEGQLTGREEVGGLQIRVYEPKPGRFPDRPPRKRPAFVPEGVPMSMPMAQGAAMGLGAGGQMRQKIYPDPYGIGTWDPENVTSVFVHIVNSEQYRELTGREPPPSPVGAKTYTESGLPWFELYDEHKPQIQPATPLTGVRSIREIDRERGETTPRPEDRTTDIPSSQRKPIRRSRGE